MSAHPVPPKQAARWTAGRIVLVVLGSIAALIGAGLLAGGAGLLWTDRTQRDSHGYLSTPTETFATSSHAIVSERIDLVEADNDGGRWFLSEGVLGDVRVVAEGDDVFVGIAPTRDVEAYLSGVAYDTVDDIRYEPFHVDYARTAGAETPAPPAKQEFWITSAAGDGAQAATWEVA